MGTLFSPGFWDKVEEIGVISGLRRGITKIFALLVVIYRRLRTNYCSFKDEIDRLSRNFGGVTIDLR